MAKYCSRERETVRKRAPGGAWGAANMFCEIKRVCPCGVCG